MGALSSICARFFAIRSIKAKSHQFRTHGTQFASWNARDWSTALLKITQNR